MSCPYRSPVHDPNACDRDAMPARAQDCAGLFFLSFALSLLDRHLDQVADLLELSLEARRDLFDHDILVMLEANRLERRTHTPRVPDSAADLLDTNVTRLGKILLRRLARSLTRMPNECARHLDGLLALRARPVLQARRLDAALTRDLFDRRQLLQTVHRRAHHVVRVRRAEALSKNIGDPSAFHDGAHCASRNHAGPWRRRLHENLSCAVLADDLVRNRSARERNVDHVATRGIDRLANGLGDFVGLAGGEADFA